MMLTTVNHVTNGARTHAPIPTAITVTTDLLNQMTKIASSPERHTFQKEGYVKRCEEEGKEPNPDYVNMFKNWREQDEENLVDAKWQQNNMEYDLRSAVWICDKVKASDNYAQNLYAAICNRQFLKLEVVPVLKDDRWSCSWRHSGGIISDMQEKGDYIDWYCSGIGSKEDGYGLDHTIPELEADGRDYVPEGEVTEEIRKDLKQLGWIVLDEEDDNR
jgi:hypothetical protein